MSSIPEKYAAMAIGHMNDDHRTDIATTLHAPGGARRLLV